ncbi:MAG: hypothetical protein RLZZ94_946 [Bacteroidota bacterium]|jgi:hypothetical protein
MNSIIYGFADICTAAFKFLPPIGAWVNWIFGLTAAAGIVYWLKYDSSVSRGGKNYMADKGE